MAKGEHLKGVGGSVKWTKGQSGNKSGRPKGSQDSKTVIAKFFETVLEGEDPLTGETVKMTVQELLFAKQIAKAINEGDTTAFSAILDRFEGKAKQTSNVSINAAHNLRYEKLESTADFLAALKEIEEEEKELDNEYQKDKTNG